jgi:hypothetical protein
MKMRKLEKLHRSSESKSESTFVPWLNEIYWAMQ